jgi:hypothetical protein
MKKEELISKIKEALVQSAPPYVTAIMHNVKIMGEDYHELDVQVVLVADKEKLTLDERMQIRHPLSEVELETGALIGSKVMARPRWEMLSTFNPYDEVMKTGTILCQPKRLLANV